MRRVVLYIAHSLDGFIAGAGGELDWLPGAADPPDALADDYGMGEFLAGVDTVLMGHATYRFVQAHPPYPYPGTTGYVWSRSRAGQRDAHVRFTAEPVADLVRRLRGEPGRDVFVIGGRAVIHPLVAADLIDEYRLFVVPVRLGDGIPLWPAGAARQALRLLGTQAHGNGLVELRYAGGSR